MVTLTSDKIDLKSKTVTRDKDGHYIMIIGQSPRKTTVINIYVPDIRAPKYRKQTLTEGKIYRNTIIVGTLIPLFQ